MTTGSIGPGTVLAGRYRLDDLLAESGGARFWRATDTVLARSVAIHALPSDDRRAPGLLEAARLSATVVDTHLLRVLDCDDENGITWVVNEWGEGVSLDLMLEQGTLPPARAAWLAREVAEAIAVGHAQGVAHGRLNPEAVLVTHSGAVKLIGYVVDASLQQPRPPDPLYGELDDREADVINLAGILYAALTGRWPGVAHSSVPAAPREARRPLRPRQVRAGVPRTLDAICERVLHKEASLHAMPIETAHEIAAALADYVGDPTLAAPLGASLIHTEPAGALHRPTPELLGVTDEPATAGEPLEESWTDEPTLAVDPDATQLAVALPAGEPAVEEPVVQEPGVQEPDVQEPDVQEPGVEEPGVEERAGQLAREAQQDPDATQFYAQGSWSGETGETGGSTRSSGPAPPPAFPETPERPLFADTERRVPASARTPGSTAGSDAGFSSGWAEPLSAPGRNAPGGSERGPDALGTAGTLGTSAQHPGRSADAGQGSRHGSGLGEGPTGFWPFEEDEAHDDNHHTGKEGRGWLRIAVVVGVLLVLLVVVSMVVYRSRENAAVPSSGGGTEPTSSPSARGQVLAPVGVSDFDPESDDPQENPADAPKAIDGDPATSWRTSTYYNDPALGGLKSGVGLVVDLGSEKQAASVTVQFKGSPTSFEVYAATAGASAVPKSLDGFEKVASRTGAGERVTVRLDPAPKTRYVLVWLTELPPVPGGYRGEIAEISVRS